MYFSDDDFIALDENDQDNSTRIATTNDGNFVGPSGTTTTVTSQSVTIFKNHSNY